MSAIDSPPTDRKRAYRVLDVPETASPKQIRSAYRKLIKRWHPDRYRAGSEEQAEATRMTERINEAYAAVKDGARAGEQLVERGSYVYQSQQTGFPWSDRPKPEPRRPFDRLGFWVRFVCGALFGVIIGFQMMIAYCNSRSGMIVAFVAGVLFCAFAAALGGDRFWRSIKPRGLWRW